MRHASAMRMTATDTDRYGGEYQVVSIRPSWSALSLGAAVAAILSRPMLSRVLLDWFAWQPRNPWNWPLLVTGFSVGASALGLLFGILGMRARRSGGAKTIPVLATVANATVLVLVLAMALAFTYIRWR